MNVHFSCFIAVLSLTAPIVQALTLDEAQRLARARHPALLAAAANVQSTTTETERSVRWENPDLDIEMEGLGGNREFTVTVGQHVTRPARMRSLRHHAQRTVDTARQAERIVQAEVDFAVHQAFVHVLAAEERLQARHELATLAREAHEATQRNHQAGAVTSLDVLQESMNAERFDLDVLAAETALTLQRRTLARLTGIPFPNLGNLEGDFFQTLEINLPEWIPADHPQLAYLQALTDQAQADRNLGATESQPGFTLGAGWQHDEEAGENRGLVSVSIALPMFSRSGTAQAAAQWAYEKQQAENLVTHLDLEQEWDELVADLQLAATTVQRYRERLKPMAEQAYHECQTGHAAGRRSTLELIAARQALAEITLETIDAQLNLQLHHAKLQRFLHHD